MECVLLLTTGLAVGFALLSASLIMFVLLKANEEVQDLKRRLEKCEQELLEIKITKINLEMKVNQFQKLTSSLETTQFKNQPDVINKDITDNHKCTQRNKTRISKVVPTQNETEANSQQNFKNELQKQTEHRLRSIEERLEAIEKAKPQPLVPLYKYYNSNAKNHLITTEKPRQSTWGPFQVLKLEGRLGYKYEGIVGYIVPKQDVSDTSS